MVTQNQLPESLNDDHTQRGGESVVVVGNGPVGFRFLKELVAHEWNQHCRITCFGEEPRVAYDRVNLTKYLSATDNFQLRYASRAWYGDNKIDLHVGDPVIRIDREQRTVHSKSGRTQAYDRLILATGSRAFMPSIPGVDLDGVFTYRTIDDLQQIRAYSGYCRRAVVLGGGLLGLEAAAALQSLKLQVSVVEMAPVLMPRQLDNTGAEVLRKTIEAKKFNVYLSKRTEKISRIPEGLLVQFQDGESLIADMLIVSAGVRARDELARDCDLAVGKRGGIVVNDELQTEDPQIWAIGECAEHNGTVYGLAAPGFQMASVLANRLRGADTRFVGSNEATRLKLLGVNVVFCGDYLAATTSKTLTFQSQDSYCKLLVDEGRIVGAVAVGDVPQLPRLQEAVANQRRLFWRQRSRFETSGRLWKNEHSEFVSGWPPQAVVCSCTGVTRGCLTRAREAGCETAEALADQTKASTVCGSCSPLLQQFVGEAPDVAVFDLPQKVLVATSVVSLVLLSLLTFAPPIAIPVSVQTATTFWQTLITDSFCKQFTGYTMTTMAVLSLVITLRKRTLWLEKFNFRHLRVIHVVLATSTLAVLIAHTGFHRGSNLNRLLFWSFLAASLTGAMVGVVSGAEARLPLIVRSWRRPLTFWHILCLWPLPLLIAFHIVSVYWL